MSQYFSNKDWRTLNRLHKYGRPHHWRRVWQFDDRRWLHDQRLPKAALRFGRLIMLGPFQLEIRHLALDHPWVRAQASRGQLFDRDLAQHALVQRALLRLINLLK